MNSTRLILILLLIGCTASVASPWPLEENSWENPQFVQRFMGSYGVRSEVEPTISPEEKALFQEILPLVKTNPRQAIDRLRQESTTNASAAIDFTLGTLLLQEQQLAEARRSLERAIQKFPDFLRAHRNLALVEIQADNLKGARTHLLKVIELGEEDGQVYGLLGYTWLATGKPASALTAYNRALLLEPNSRDWQSGKAQALMDSGQNREAIAVLGEMIGDTPGDARLWQAQANAYLALDEPLSAARNLEIIRRLGTASDQSLALLGDIYLNEGLDTLAARTYLEALGRKRTLPPARALRAARSLVLNGNPAEASELLNAVQTTWKDRLSAEAKGTLSFLKARIALAEDDAETAADYLESALETDPLNGEALLLSADLASNKGDYVRAELLLERALNLSGYRADALVQLAELQVRQQNFTQAADLLRQAQEFKPRADVARYLEQVERAARTEQ